MSEQGTTNETLSELFQYVIDLSHDMDAYHSQKLMEVAGIIGGVIASRAPRDQLPSKDQLAELKRYHAEIVESDGAECEAMQLTRWAIDEIERLREDLARAESAHAAVMAENAYYKAELACVARVMDDAVLGLRQLRDFANQQWESVQRRMLSNAQTDSGDWCPSCTKPYSECRCNGVQQ